jgi:hypothetical protein
MTQRHDNQYDSLLNRLTELQKEVRQQGPAQKQEASAPKPAPAPAPVQTPHLVQQAPAAAPAAHVPPVAQAAPAGIMRTGGSLLPIRGKSVTPAPAHESVPDASKPETTQPIELGALPSVTAPAKAPPPSANPEDTVILKPNEEFPRTKGRGPVWPV